MLDCRQLNFSPRLCAERTARARVVLGEAVLGRLLAWALFLLGVQRTAIAVALPMPEGTVRTVLRRLRREGLRGLADQRRKDAGRPPSPPPPTALAAVVRLAEDGQTLHLGEAAVRLPPGNHEQQRVVLLSLMGEGLLSTAQVAAALGVTPGHARKLKAALLAGDVAAVLDKRAGQPTDYRVDVQAKGQLVEQFVVALAARGRASAAAVARRVADVYQRELPERTVRHHLRQLGLAAIKASLLTQLQAVKRTLGD